MRNLAGNLHRSHAPTRPPAACASQPFNSPDANSLLISSQTNRQYSRGAETPAAISAILQPIARPVGCAFAAPMQNRESWGAAWQFAPWCKDVPMAAIAARSHPLAPWSEADAADHPPHARIQQRINHFDATTAPYADHGSTSC